jgi:hypothetical protein
VGNEAGPLINLNGAFDLHFHPAPCIFPRLATDREVAQVAAQLGFAGLLLKCHHESTVSRALLVGRDFPSLHIYGGIVLNNYVGGINRSAVEAALKLGAKEVWLPTIDSRYHAEIHGGIGRYDVQVPEKMRQECRCIETVTGGKITREAQQVFELVAEYDAILGTCHQSYDELRVIISCAHKIGVRKILLTHPFFKVPGLSLEQITELVDMGAIAEFGYCTISPMWAYATVGKVAQAIRSLGAERCVLVSDAGQRHNPMPPEALRVFAQCLFESGITENEIGVMVRENPARLLGLSPVAETQMDCSGTQ